MKMIYQTIAGGVAAAFLAIPAFGQSPMRMSDCSTITPAYQAACNADNDLRKQCNATSSNPLQCYNAKKAAASSPKPAITAPTMKLPRQQGTDPAPAAAPAPAAKAPPPAAKAPAPAAAPASTGATPVTSIPQGAKACATDGKTCSATGNWTGVYGANNKFAKISGSGSFTCLPGTFKIDDPVPGVLKTCYIIAAAAAPVSTTARPAPAAVTKAPTQVATAQPKVNPLPLSCKGGLIHTTKKFANRNDFNKSFPSADTMAATSLDGATNECRASCAKTGEPAPCGWFTLVQWREDSSATGKSRTAYTCHKVNARGYKDAFKPTMPNDTNFGNAANGLFYKDAWTYPCAR